MSLKNKRISFFLINDTLKYERNYKASIGKNLEQEELKYIGALQADAPTEIINPIKERIKYLRIRQENKRK